MTAPPNMLALRRAQSDLLPLPAPRVGAVRIRLAVPGPADIAFIDALQKTHSKMVGWSPTKQLETNIKQKNILIAEDEASREPLGYCLFKDKYFKREDVGIVHQLNVVPQKHRGLVGAALVQAAFDHCPRGVKLFCCWCAQDIEANHFWESIGFVPLAFRAGSRGAAQGGRRKDQRIHIFWQKRIREGDNETPYWYPSETTGGSLRENRIVLPIPPDTHWSAAKPIVLPGESDAPALPAASRPKRERTMKAPPLPVSVSNGLRFGEPVMAPKAKPEKPKREKQRNNPEHIALAREFRDRYLDEVNSGRCLPEAWGAGKYDVSRQLDEAPDSVCLHQVPLLEQKAAA